MIKVTEDETEIRGNIPEILDEIMRIFKALNKKCNTYEKLMILKLLRDAAEMISIEKE